MEGKKATINVEKSSGDKLKKRGGGAKPITAEPQSPSLLLDISRLLYSLKTLVATSPCFSMPALVSSRTTTQPLHGLVLGHHCLLNLFLNAQVASNSKAMLRLFDNGNDKLASLTLIELLLFSAKIPSICLTPSMFKTQSSLPWHIRNGSVILAMSLGRLIFDGWATKAQSIRLLPSSVEYAAGQSE